MTDLRLSERRFALALLQSCFGELAFTLSALDGRSKRVSG